MLNEFIYLLQILAKNPPKKNICFAVATWSLSLFIIVVQHVGQPTFH